MLYQSMQYEKILHTFIQCKYMGTISKYIIMLHTLILHTLELFFTCVAMYETNLNPAISQKIKI